MVNQKRDDDDDCHPTIIVISIDDIIDDVQILTPNKIVRLPSSLNHIKQLLANIRSIVTWRR